MSKGKDDLYLLEHLNDGFGFWVRARRQLAHVKSPFQDIEVLDTVNFGRTLRIDDYFMTSDGDEFYYHEPIVHANRVEWHVLHRVVRAPVCDRRHPLRQRQ